MYFKVNKFVESIYTRNCTNLVSKQIVSKNFKIINYTIISVDYSLKVLSSNMYKYTYYYTLQ